MALNVHSVCSVLLQSFDARRLRQWLCFGIILFLIQACASNVEISEPVTETVPQGFTNFETEPVKPLAISPNEAFLYALNTFDDRLEVYALTEGMPRFIGETLVGLRPVALTLPTETEAWVVNHLSDAVSVVDLSNPRQPRVIRTLAVGDEPRGIVTAGTNGRYIYVACARRDADLTPGVGRAEIWVFDRQQLDQPPEILHLFGMKPRALAVSQDGRRVYAGVFHSGNRTTTTSGADAVRLGYASEQGPYSFGRYKARPKAGAIVHQQGDQWLDLQGRDWTEAVPFELPDEDVFVIDATQTPPAVIDRVNGVGTVLFDLAVQPGTGDLWVANTEAANLIPHEPQLRSRFAVNRVSRLSAADGGAWQVKAIDLNPHIDRDLPTVDVETRSQSLAQPSALLFHPEGQEAYVTAFGSQSVGVLDADCRVTARIPVGFGPGGMAIATGTNRLYVLNHLSAELSVVDLLKRQLVSTMPLRHNPAPPTVRRGRPLLYDAKLTSGWGDLSCATCHVFGDFDGIAWDLGDPVGTSEPIPVALKHPVEEMQPRQLYHPIKGPMMTQSLRGLAQSAPFHWRGDRFGPTTAADQDIPSFMQFNGTYVNLLGLEKEFPDAEMRHFARFAMTLQYPPNPNQRLDRSLKPRAQAGFDFYNGPFKSDRGVQTCADCHSLPLGTNRRVNFEGYQIGRDMKTAHLRNMYQKVGRYNRSGPQVTGFGLLHDGSMDTVVNFLKLDVFTFPGQTEEEKDLVRRQLHAYVMAFDTGMAPAVGQQITIKGQGGADDKKRLAMIQQQARVGDCDLIAYGWLDRHQRTWLLQQDRFQSNLSERGLSMSALQQRFQKVGEPLTFMCVPPGDGYRTAMDRDMDGLVNEKDPSLAVVRNRDRISGRP